MLALLLILASFAGWQCRPTPPPARPNVLLIFMDDLGWPAISANGGGLVPTPHIDALARDGMRFTDAYATPQCTPSRAALLTGQHTARNRMWHVIPGYQYPYMGQQEPPYLENLPFETHTLAEALKAQGYATGILGQWHLNVYGPVGYYTRLFATHAHEYGFDSVDPATDPAEYQGKVDKGVRWLTDQAIGFLRAHRDTTFFLYLAHHTIHGPVLAPDSLVEKYRRQGYPDQGLNHARYLAAIEHFDRETGRLLDSLDALGLRDNTLVLFTSDNGGVDAEYSNAPFRYGKGTLYKGGTRVPWLLRWPAQVAPGTVCTTPVHLMDVYPTLLAAAGGAPAPGHVFDGMSLLPLLHGDTIPRRDMYTFAPLYDRGWGATPGVSIRRGDFKLIHFFGDYVDRDDSSRYLPGPRTELYDLAADPGETLDLADNLPRQTADLRAALQAWLDTMAPGLPVPNPAFDPDSLWVRRSLAETAPQ
ncbi:MAG: sulfatase [Bacteroidia bacterium]